MRLEIDSGNALGFKSASQSARCVTESWGAQNLYCTACDSDSVSRTPANTRAVDFRCPCCAAAYQLKAGRRWNERSIPDAGYAAMMAAIQSDNVPNLLVLQYTQQWHVQNLMLIPSFLFNASAIQERKPLTATARRAGWVGCNILLSAMPDLGKLRLVDDGSIIAPGTIRSSYQRLRPLAHLAPKVRGWTLDVLRVVQSLSRREFLLADIYAHEERLQILHPDNRSIRPKIRQQLQVLRDLGFLAFRGKGLYELLM